MGKYIFFHEQVHQISTREVLHHQVQIVAVLEWTLQTHYPRIVLRVCQHVPLLSRLHHLIFKDHLTLLQLFDCHRIIRLRPFAQSNLAKGTLADDLERLEIIDRYLFTVLSELLCLLVRNLLFKFLLLHRSHPEGLHFLVELFPILSLLLFKLYHFGVALLDKILGSFDLLSSSFWHL